MTLTECTSSTSLTRSLSLSLLLVRTSYSVGGEVLMYGHSAELHAIEPDGWRWLYCLRASSLRSPHFVNMLSRLH